MLDDNDMPLFFSDLQVLPGVSPVHGRPISRRTISALHKRAIQIVNPIS